MDQLKLRSVFFAIVVVFGTCNGGRTTNHPREAPDEDAHYVPPGDHRQENYRAATFQSLLGSNVRGPPSNPNTISERARMESFPVGPVNASGPSSSNALDRLTARALARSGLYNTGNRRAVECSGCGQATENFTRISDPADPRWHSDDCWYRRGNSAREICINHGNDNSNRTTGDVSSIGTLHMQSHQRYVNTLYLERELDRLASFRNWPSSDRSPPPALLAKDGFFFLGDLDRTQCFFCSGVLQNWNRRDNVGTIHEYHFPQCSIVRGTEHRNLGIQDVPLSERVQQYPCLFPYHSFMSNERDRLNSFDHRWLSSAEPSLLSSAGFFYLGDRDRVRCFYCDGGIQGFKVGQDPWVEHARGYPLCQFLLQRKGARFVHHILSGYPHVNRPIMPRQRGGVLDHFVEPADTDKVEIVDTQGRMQKLRQQVEDYMVRSDIVQLILQMGFSTALVAGVIRDRMIEQNSESGSGSNTNDPYESAEKLLDDVQKREQEMKDEPQHVNSDDA